MTDYLTTDTELTSVANAIRTKGGTSASLSWPTEYVSAIGAISSGIGELILTESLGTISTTSTSAASLGKSIQIPVPSSGDLGYDVLIIETSVDTVTASRHAATIAAIFIAKTSNTTTSGTIANAKCNLSLTSGSITNAKVSTTAYGIYPNSISLVSTGDSVQFNIPMYRRYNSSQTGTINGDYTTRVYGINLIDLIGG